MNAELAGHALGGLLWWAVLYFGVIDPFITYRRKK